MHTSVPWVLVAAAVAACGGESLFDGDGAPVAGHSGAGGTREMGGASGSVAGGSSGAGGTASTGGASGAGTGGQATGGTGTGGSSRGGSSGTGGTARGGGGAGGATGGTGHGGAGTGGTGHGGAGTGGMGGAIVTGGAGGVSGSAGSGASAGTGGTGGMSDCPLLMPSSPGTCSPAMTCFYYIPTGCLCSDVACTVVSDCLPRPKRHDTAERIAPIAGAPGVAGTSGVQAPPVPSRTCVCDGTSWSCEGIF